MASEQPLIFVNNCYLNSVKRKGNTKPKVDVEKFDEVKKLFHQDIRNVVVMDEVPAELVINWDQTGLNYVPVSQQTMAKEEAKRVEIDGKDDKHQITAVFGCSMSGDFLPPQLVYQGKTPNVYHLFSFHQTGVMLIQQTVGRMRRPWSSVLLKSFCHILLTQRES